MPSWEGIADSLWKALAQLNPGDVQAEADKLFRLALIGAPASGKSALGCALAGLPAGQPLPPRLERHLSEHRLPLSAEDVNALESATLLVLLLDATKGDYVQEVAAADYLSYLGRPMLVCYNKMDMVPVETRLIRGQARWRGAEIMPLTATQPDTVRELLVPAVLETLPEHALALAHRLPLFRTTVAGRLVERTSRVNATYASASGLAQSVPRLRPPLTPEDIKVLASNQAAMVYRLGLAHGLPADWHQDLAPLRSVVDVEQLWRKLARRIVGIIPLWSLRSKVGVAYGGTVVTGKAMRTWFDSGQGPTVAMVREWCRDTAAQSETTSEDLVAKARDALPAAPVERARPSGFALRLPWLLRRRSRPSCPACGQAVAPDATFCAYCGQALEAGDEAPASPQGEA
jgi:hypothetical protein